MACLLNQSDTISDENTLSAATNANDLRKPCTRSCAASFDDVVWTLMAVWPHCFVYAMFYFALNESLALIVSVKISSHSRDNVTR